MTKEKDTAKLLDWAADFISVHRSNREDPPDIIRQLREHATEIRWQKSMTPHP